MGSENKERYQLVEADLKMFSRSGVRSKIMLILLEGGRTVGELEKITNTRSTTLLHSIKDLTDLDLVEKSIKYTALPILAGSRPLPWKIY